MTTKIFSADDEPLGTFDWEGLEEKPVQEAALAVKQALYVLDGSEETILHTRMRILRVARRLELWKLEDDPEVGAPFASMARWIKSNWPQSWRYCKDALDAEEALDPVPMETLAGISGANLKVLASQNLSSNLRTNKKVLKAAASKTKDQFVEYLSAEHGQHMEPVRLMPKLDSERFEHAVQMVMQVDDCNRPEAFVAIAELVESEYLSRYEHLKEETA